ncbi:MAG: hypothetical protein K8J08_07910 [Thermoanaerobaculia bacterium]|nr:hypothetical protein [Thermoanaerobaculia bacterium]
MKDKSETVTDELREEYDLSALKNGERGRYYKRAIQGTNLVLLDPDVANAFPTSEAVNEALRLLVSVAATATKSPSGA